ncbi:transcriptional regulator [Acetobacteraceae bacterium KSS8]|uniref:Transcriptional regulator n=1 Tax=Endosaccharibacter trunci TaxID=2812733 RepID=A0ABT1WDH1_9PROT|nr:transcriptional regulator [Acetobacteraceae bacterium KSS8]
MSKKAFDMIAEGLNEALAISRGQSKPARLYVPAEIDVKAIRDKTALSQGDFAAAFGFTVHQVRQWEQGRNRPTGGIRAYLMVIDENPSEILALLRSATGSARKAA